MVLENQLSTQLDYGRLRIGIVGIDYALSGIRRNGHQAQ